MDGHRIPPTEPQHDPVELSISPEVMEGLEEYRQVCDEGIAPEKVADDVIQAIREERFQIYTHPEYGPIVRARIEAVVGGHNPVPWSSSERRSKDWHELDEEEFEELA